MINLKLQNRSEEFIYMVMEEVAQQYDGVALHNLRKGKTESATVAAKQAEAIRYAINKVRPAKVEDDSPYGDSIHVPYTEDPNSIDPAS